MTLVQSVALANEMKMHGISESLERRLAEFANNPGDPTELIRLLLEDEKISRDNKRASRLVTRARFRRSCQLEDWDQSFDRGISKAQLKELALLNFFHNREHLMLIGGTGSGKTHLAISLGHRLCQQGISTSFASVNLLLEEVSAQRAAGKYLNFIKGLAKISVLILDDFGLRSYQHDEAMVRHADRLGLLVWCEVPVYWGIDFANESTLANGIDQINELVVRDRSRACVILWSIANETLPGPDRTAFLSSLAAEVRRLDPTRLVTAALLTMPPSDNAVHIDDPLGEVVDVIGVNQYLGWYYGNRDDIARTTWRSSFDKPIVFSELGAGAKAGRHGDENEIWTEEFQAAVYVEQLKMIERCDDCAGVSPWILKDFRTPVRVLPGIQDGYNRKGLVSEEGERKLAFDVLRAFYTDRVQ